MWTDRAAVPSSSLEGDTAPLSVSIQPWAHVASWKECFWRRAATGYSAQQFPCFRAGDARCLLSLIKTPPEDTGPLSQTRKLQAAAEVVIWRYRPLRQGCVWLVIWKGREDEMWEQGEDDCDLKRWTHVCSCWKRKQNHTCIHHQTLWVQFQLNRQFNDVTFGHLSVLDFCTTDVVLRNRLMFYRLSNNIC